MANYKVDRETQRFVRNNNRRITEEKECGRKKNVRTLAKQLRRIARDPNDSPELWCELSNFSFEKIKELIDTLSGAKFTIEEFKRFRGVTSNEDMFNRSNFQYKTKNFLDIL